MAANDTTDGSDSTPPVSLNRSWRRFLSKKLAAAGLFFITLQILVAIFAGQLAPFDPYASDFLSTWDMPSYRHWFGTDDLGRDVLSRLIYGSRISISVGILSQVAAATVGIPIGAISALRGGRVDFVVMRIVDVVSSLPTILFYILLMVALGPGFWNLILAMTLTGWIGIARLVRGQVLSLKKADFIRASHSMGASSTYIFRKHIIRNVIAHVIVAIAIGIPGAMFAEAGLSFLGLGITAPQCSWGQMIGMYESYIRTGWHLTVFPSILLALTMLAWFLVADGVRFAYSGTRG